MRRRLRGKENREGSKRSGVALRVGIQECENPAIDYQYERANDKLTAVLARWGVARSTIAATPLATQRRIMRVLLLKRRTTLLERRMRCPSG